jgi:pre-mRNA-splicing factor ATP-dependent RNA helicase DHX16
LEKLKTRYTATGDNEPFQAVDVEQQEWEEAQLGRSKAQYGSRDAAAAAAKAADEKYDYVFDAQIDFVRELTAAQLDDAAHDNDNDDDDDDGGGGAGGSGLGSGLRAPRTAAELAQQEHQSLQDVRRSLPIFQYRQHLLDAVAAHQVLVIVGETGSGKVCLYISVLILAHTCIIRLIF